MAASRVIGVCTVSSTSCGLRGVLLDVPFGGGGCPSVLDPFTFSWEKAVSALTGGEQTQVASAVTMLQGKLDAEEACSGLRSVRYFEMVLGSGGTVEVATAWLNGPTVGGKARQLWARWSKQRSAFSSGERTQLDAVVSMLSGYLASEEALP